MITINDLAYLIKGNTVQFSHYQRGILYYKIEHIGDLVTDWYEFQVPIEDCGDGKFLDKDKAMLFMRYIRKAIENQELRKL